MSLYTESDFKLMRVIGIYIFDELYRAVIVHIFGSVDFIHVEAVGSFAVSGTCFVAEYRGFDNAVIGAQGNCREYNDPDKRDNYEENILGKFFQYFQQLFHEASERRLGLPFAFFEYLLFLVEIVVHQIHLWFLS